MLPYLRTLPSAFIKASRRITTGAAIAAIATMPVNVSAQTWQGVLTGANESPPNASTATGFVSMSLSGNFLSLTLEWSGLTGGPVVAGHIHCCTNPGSNVGVAVGFAGLPSVSTGSYSHVFDLTVAPIYTLSFLNNFGGGTTEGAQTALIDGLNSGRAYVNLHNAAYPAGEIRANVVVTPEPASMAMLGAGLLVVGAVVRSRKRAS